MNSTLRIKHLKVQNQIEIDDGMNQMGVIYYSLMILTLANASINLAGEKHIWVWIVLGLTALCFLIYYFKKISFRKSIPVEKIKSFQAKNKFGKTRYFLELESGRKRFLNDLNTLEKIDQADRFFKSLKTLKTLSEQ